jgi:hypothetical protein
MAGLTYIYCVVANRSHPTMSRRPRGVPGLARPRLLELGRGLWAVVADAPAAQFSAGAINGKLADLDWVSRAALAHEAVVESFITARAVLPMKLFTIFSSDERALENLHERRAHIDAALKRVAGHQEFGVRVRLVREAARPSAVRRAPASGVAYLRGKKSQRDATSERAVRAREVVAELFDRLAVHASLARRRAASELPADGGPLLLDAAFLIPRGRARRFAAAVASRARTLSPQGYGITMTGPWPPYSFMQE